MTENFKQNTDGTWTNAIPYPLFVGLGLRKAKCDCGKLFKNVPEYEKHYALEHMQPAN